MSLEAEFFAAAISPFGNAIRVEDDQVLFLDVDDAFFVFLY